jgi:hypothetical protein
MPRLEPKSQRGRGHGEHTDDDRARNFAHGEPGDDQESHGGEPGLRLSQVAKSDQRSRIVGDDAGILQRDQRQKEADAGGDAELQAHRNSVDQPSAQRRQR